MYILSKVLYMLSQIVLVTLLVPVEVCSVPIREIPAALLAHGLSLPARLLLLFTLCACSSMLGEEEDRQM